MMPANSIGGSAWRRGTRARGSAMIWTMVSLVCLTGFCSLAVDVGRVHVVRGELRHAADAAALYSAAILARSGPALARSSAVAAAADNKADGTTVALDPTVDVEFGTWDPATRAFTLLSGASESTATAVRVTTRRTEATGNPITLAFGGLIGVPKFNVTVHAIARVNPRRPGIIGLDYITMSGNSGVSPETGGFRSRDGSSTIYGSGTIESNGNISLSGSTLVRGNATPGPGKTTTVSGASSVTGSTTPATKLLEYPAQPAGTAATTNNNSSVPTANLSSSRDFQLGNSSLTLPGGVYYFNSVQLGSGSTVSFSGPATVYMTASAQIAGTLNAFNNSPGNLRIVMTTAGTDITLSSNAVVYMDLYAPLSVFKGGGRSTVYGSVISRGIELSGTSRILFDESITTSAPRVWLVQ